MLPGLPDIVPVFVFNPEPVVVLETVPETVPVLMELGLFVVVDDPEGVCDGVCVCVIVFVGVFCAVGVCVVVTVLVNETEAVVVPVRLDDPVCVFVTVCVFVWLRVCVGVPVLVLLPLVEGVCVWDAVFVGVPD